MRIRHYIGIMLAIAAAVLLCVWGMSRLDSGSGRGVDLSEKTSLVASHLGVTPSYVLSADGGYDRDSGLYEYSFTVMAVSGGVMTRYEYANEADLTADTALFLTAVDERGRFS